MTKQTVFPKIGDALKQKRLELGLTQADVAAKTGYSCSSIRNMERGAGGVLINRYGRYAAAVNCILNMEFKD